MTSERFTVQDKLAEIERELAQRRRVYPRLIDAGKMSRTAADRQTAVLQAIRNDYQLKLVGERLSL